jgi:hypothetical protein
MNEAALLANEAVRLGIGPILAEGRRSTGREASLTPEEPCVVADLAPEVFPRDSYLTRLETRDRHVHKRAYVLSAAVTSRARIVRYRWGARGDGIGVLSGFREAPKRLVAIRLIASVTGA